MCLEIQTVQSWPPAGHAQELCATADSADELAETWKTTSLLINTRARCAPYISSGSHAVRNMHLPWMLCRKGAWAEVLQSPTAV